MALVLCSECQKEISESAEACPYCGNPITKKKEGEQAKKGCLGCLGVIVVLWFIGWLISIPSSSRNEQKLKSELSYLNSVSDISWFEIDGRAVYIGFREVPKDLRGIVNSAAQNGSRAIDGGAFSAWAVLHAERGWRQGQRKPGFICSAHARRGIVKDSDCPQ